MYGEEEEASDDGGGLCRGRMGVRLKRAYWGLFCFVFFGFITFMHACERALRSGLGKKDYGRPADRAEAEKIILLKSSRSIERGWNGWEKDWK
jgi:hypothetical protein